MSELSLSIIVPYYNCHNTVELTLKSLMQQNVSCSFEVVLVNDGSTDESTDRLRKIIAKYNSIKYIEHEYNKGGGAARNTGIKHSSHKYILCFDADDVLPENMLSRLLFLAEKNDLDGICFEQSRLFSRSINKVSGVTHYEFHNQLSSKMEILSKNTLPVFVNFMFKRAIYDCIGGYPENHGFDTQGFGLVFLLKTNKVKVCPDSFFYHRIANKYTKSYFEREYEKGYYSLNYYLMYHPLHRYMSEAALTELIKFDVLNHNNLYSDNYCDYIISLSKALQNKFWISKKNILVDEKLNDGNCLYNYFILKEKKEYLKSMPYLYETIEKNGITKILTLELLYCLYNSNNIKQEGVIMYSEIIESLMPKRQKLDMTPSFLKMVINKLTK